MIGIQNVSQKARSSGLHTYEVFVTQRVDGKIVRRNLFRFRHRREEDLSALFERAARAAKRAEHERMQVIHGMLLEAGVPIARCNTKKTTKAKG